MVKCGRCAGAGHQKWDEDGRPVSDVCYRCGGTGEISEESARDLQLEAVANVLASQSVQSLRDACNANPEGEGWAFCAAENMMNERDYTTAVTMDHAADHLDEIGKLSQRFQDALINALLPRKEEPAARSAPAAPTAANDDEFPF
jgi:hypothetical protein